MSDSATCTWPSCCHTAKGQCRGAGLRAYLAAHAPVTLHDAALVCGYDSTEDALHNDQTRAVTLAIMAMMRAEYADALIAALKGGAA